MRLTTITLGAAGLVTLLGSTSALAAPPPATRDITQVLAGTYRLDPLHSKVTWAVDHYGFSTYQGQFTAASGTLALAEDPTRSQLTIQIPLDQVVTGSALDEHLAGDDFFDVAVNPIATFRSTRITLAGDNQATIEGQLTLNGQTHPLTLDATFNRAAVYPYDDTYRLGFDADAEMRRSDWGIDFLLPKGSDGMGISDRVALEIEAEFTPAH
ncbi:YceI family protein [Salinicola tamaricis]|uniref:YceI family protein n=1 Tax=Salinicola tamaricis TaxID=1771309 RepID=UPI000D0A01CE|nr:YceI family protein [Salinicola tamaricis]